MTTIRKNKQTNRNKKTHTHKTKLMIKQRNVSSDIWVMTGTHCHMIISKMN